MTKRNRRTWDGHRNVVQQGWDSDVQNFTLTYSEALEDTYEAVLFKIILNGCMCGYPVCCVVHYAARWYRFFQTGDQKHTKADKIVYTALGQPYSECHNDVHIQSFEETEQSKGLNSSVLPDSTVERYKE
jgi:hypothetical protein